MRGGRIPRVSGIRIVTAGMLVGVLDGLFAVALFVVALKVTTPVRVFQSIASAVIGPSSFQGGLATTALGLALHFTVAHAWAAVYFLALRASSLLRFCYRAASSRTRR